jgi:hypothetical protein
MKSDSSGHSLQANSHGFAFTSFPMGCTIRLISCPPGASPVPVSMGRIGQ